MKTAVISETYKTDMTTFKEKIIVVWFTNFTEPATLLIQSKSHNVRRSGCLDVVPSSSQGTRPIDTIYERSLESRQGRLQVADYGLQEEVLLCIYHVHIFFILKYAFHFFYIPLHF